MRSATRLLALFLLLNGAFACAAETGQPGSGGGGGNGSGGGGSGGEVMDGVELSGDIAESGTFSGTIRVNGNATILPGVDIAIAAGSDIIAANGALLSVRGSLLVDGSADQTVSIVPEEGSAGWVGIAVETGGAATIRHATGTRVATLLNCKAGAVTCALERIDFEKVGKVVDASATATLVESRVVDMANSAVLVHAGGDLTVRDSELMTSVGDIVVATGGRLLVEFSNIGGTQDTYEHCNIHIGAADTATIRYSNLVTGTYGMMIGGIDGAVVNYNNFEGNGIDVDPVGIVTAADFRYNYWDKGAPTALGGEYDFASAAAAHIAQAGPRI